MLIKIVKQELINKVSKSNKEYKIQRLLCEFGEERQWLEYYFGSDSVNLETGTYRLSADSFIVKDKKLVISDFPTFEKVQATTAKAA